MPGTAVSHGADEGCQVKSDLLEKNDINGMSWDTIIDAGNMAFLMQNGFVTTKVEHIAPGLILYYHGDSLILPGLKVFQKPGMLRTENHETNNCVATALAVLFKVPFFQMLEEISTWQRVFHGETRDPMLGSTGISGTVIKAFLKERGAVAKEPKTREAKEMKQALKKNKNAVFLAKVRHRPNNGHMFASYNGIEVCSFLDVRHGSFGNNMKRIEKIYVLPSEESK